MSSTPPHPQHITRANFDWNKNLMKRKCDNPQNIFESSILSCMYCIFDPVWLASKTLSSDVCRVHTHAFWSHAQGRESVPKQAEIFDGRRLQWHNAPDEKAGIDATSLQYCKIWLICIHSRLLITVHHNGCNVIMIPTAFGGGSSLDNSVMSVSVSLE